MTHDICRVISFERVAAYTLRVWFDDASSQLIDFGPVLKRRALRTIAGSDPFRPGEN